MATDVTRKLLIGDFQNVDFVIGGQATNERQDGTKEDDKQAPSEALRKGLFEILK